MTEQTLELRDVARLIIQHHVRYGIPMHPRRRDHLVKAAEPDEDFEQDLHWARIVRETESEERAFQSSILEEMCERFREMTGLTGTDAA